MRVESKHKTYRRITSGKRVEMPREHNVGATPFLEAIREDSGPVSREEYNALLEEFYKLERTVYGIQQLLTKAGTYQGKPRGRLPR